MAAASMARTLLNTLLLENENVNCDCSPPLQTVFAEFKMAAIAKRSLSFTNPIIVACEYHESGKRLFVCTSKRHFTHYFMHVRSAVPYATWDEILMEQTPIKCYCDVEYYKAVNAERCAELSDLVEALYESMKLAFCKEFGILLEDVSSMRQVATTQDKFSQHWLFWDGRQNATARLTVNEVGEFIRKFAANNEEYTVKGKDGRSKSHMLDTSVYSNGQNFRMLGSPKFGRNNTLVYAGSTGDHQFTFHACSQCEKILLDGIITLWPDVPVNSDQRIELDLAEVVDGVECNNLSVSLRYVACQVVNIASKAAPFGVNANLINNELVTALTAPLAYACTMDGDKGEEISRKIVRLFASIISAVHRNDRNMLEFHVNDELLFKLAQILENFVELIALGEQTLASFAGVNEDKEMRADKSKVKNGKSFGRLHYFLKQIVERLENDGVSDADWLSLQKSYDALKRKAGIMIPIPNILNAETARTTFKCLEENCTVLKVVRQEYCKLTHERTHEFYRKLLAEEGQIKDFVINLDLPGVKWARNVVAFCEILERKLSIHLAAL